MPAYCTVDDLMLEALPMNTVISKQKYIDASADEIDIILGDRYVTPIHTDDVPANRRTKLFLKQCNAQLASGRIIIAVTLTREMDSLHAVGRQMINMTLAALQKIAGGEGELPGAGTNPTADVLENKILVAQVDGSSRVLDYEDVMFGRGGFSARNRPWLFGDVETRRISGG
jgi:hypothetical protein